jgi:hypothetical protein
LSGVPIRRGAGLPPSRDAPADSPGVSWLLANHRDLIDAEYALNEGGGGELKRGKALANDVQAAEKVCYSVSLEVRNAGREFLYRLVKTLGG